VRINFKLLVLYLVLLAGLAACFGSETDFLQGTWETHDVHVFDSWTFDGGEFAHATGNRMNVPNLLSGRFQIIEKDGQKLTVELYDLDGQFLLEDTSEIVIYIDQEAESIQIRGKTFTRLHP
jgi:hypothetical protein